MATAEQYAGWIVANQDKKDTPEFATVAAAYKDARSIISKPVEIQKSDIDTSKGRAAYMSQFPKDEQSQKKAQFDYEKADAQENVDWHTNLAKGALSGSTILPRAVLKAVQFLNPFDKVGRVNAIQEGVNSFNEENKDQPGFGAGRAIAEIGATAGIPVPYSSGAVGILPKIGQGLQNIGTSAAAGGGQGLLSEGSKGVIPGMVAGGVMGGAMELAKPLAGGVGKIIDLLAGRGGDVRAAKILRDVSGDKLSAIKEELVKSSGDVTAAQAAVGADSTRFSALGARGEKAMSEEANRLAGVQESGRQATLDAVKPYLPAAEKARSAVTAPLYEAADKSTVKIDKEMFDILGRAPKGTIEKAAEIARMEGRPFVLDAGGNEKITGESAHYIKRALSDIAYAPAQGVGKDTQKAAKGVLEDFIKKFEETVPIYKQARSEFADMSKEVNQAELIQAMQDTLKASKGGERVQPFLEAQGRGENALIKRADQSPRFGKIEDILNKEQLQARDKVVSELMRDAKVKELASGGSGEVAQVLLKDASSFRLPWTMSAKVAALNKGLDVMESSLNSKTMDKVYKAMQNPKDTIKLLETVPSAERIKIINALTKMKTTSLAPIAGEAAQ